MKPSDDPLRFHHWLLWLSLLTLLDQAAKGMVRTLLLPGARLPVLDPVLFISYVQNRGFSWYVPALPGWASPLYNGLCLLILLLAFPVYDFYTRRQGRSPWARLALIALSAGVAGNLLDGLALGFTTDFIQIFRSPSANFSDLYSYIGLVALIIETVRFHRNRESPRPGIKERLAEMAQTRRSFFRFLKGYFVRKP